MINPDTLFQSIWLSALRAEIGIGLATNDPERARQRLYQARASQGPGFAANLQIRIAPEALGDCQLVIVRATRSVAEDFGL